MRVLLNHSQAKKLHENAPDYVGVLFSPERTRYYDGIPFAIDNGAFGAWRRGVEWDANVFRSVVKKFAQLNPLFVVCPDVIANKTKTFELWANWSGWLKAQSVPVAFVFCDGMTIDEIPHDADYVFIGGSDIHILSAIKNIKSINQPVHVGRVNYHTRLWLAHNNGAISCDGTGWFRGDLRQKQILLDYLAIKSGQQQKESNSLFHVGHYCS